MQKFFVKLSPIIPWLTFMVGLLLTVFGWYAATCYSTHYMTAQHELQASFGKTSHHAAYLPWIALALGTLVNALLTGLAYLACRTQRHAEAIAAKMMQQQRSQEAELRKLALVASRTNNVVIITDAQGNTEWVNDAFTRRFGYDFAEVAGQRTCDIFAGPETDPKLLEYICQEVFAGKPFTGELPSYDKLGRTSWNNVGLQPILDESGRVVNVIIILTDITANKQAQKELSVKEAQYRGIFEAATNGLLIFSQDNVVVEANPAACKMHGYTHDEIIGMHGRQFIPPDVLERYLGMLERVKCGESFFTENQAYRKDGSTYDVDVHGSQFMFRGEPHFLFVVNDVTQRKKVESDLREYAEAIEAANRSLEKYALEVQKATQAKSDFLAHMSHELRTPLTAILGFTEILRNEGDLSRAPPTRIDAIDTVIRNSEYLLLLINDLLDLSKIEAGKFSIERVCCSPLDIILDVKSLISVRAMAKQLRFNVEYEGPLPESITSDPIRLRQILINLLGNAIKFTEIGSVQLRLHLDSRDPDNPMIEFIVVDTGPGMREDQLKIIFEPFVQADRNIYHRYGGTGLGLAFSRKLAYLLGGEITVESALGKGSAFRLRLPTGPLDGVRMIQSPVSEEIYLIKTSCCLLDEPKDVQLKGSILLAEDGIDNQRLIAHILRKAGADITGVDNGQAALDEALNAWRRGNPFDLILMDMQMPVMDGCTAVRRLRDLGYSHPIVALTAHAMQEARRQCLEAGCDNYVTKPISRRSLLGLAAQYLKQNKSEVSTDSSKRINGAIALP
jgi:PAS domain S-box-containing protein